jgi:hypothetical protein
MGKAVRGASGGGGGPDTWYVTTATSNSSQGIGASFMEFDAVTIAQAGSCTKLRARLAGGLAEATVKMAIYDNGGTLKGQGSAVLAAETPQGELEVTLDTPFNISAASYSIAISSSASITAYTQTGGTGNYATQAHAGFPPGTLPAPEGNFSETLRMGAYVD